MPVRVDHDGELLYQQIGARAPQMITSSGTGTASTPQRPSSITTTINTSPYFSDPSMTPDQVVHDNSRAVRTIVAYFFLILGLFIASIVIFRRLFYMRMSHRRGLNNHNHGGPRSRHPFPRTTGLPRVNMRGYPLLENYFLPLPLPAASTNARRTRANDIDLDGRRFTSVGAEVDHDGFLRDKDLLPKYETLGGPPKYADLDLQQVLVTGTVVPPIPVPLPPPLTAGSERNSGITLVEAETTSSSCTRDISDSPRSAAIPDPSTRP